MNMIFEHVIFILALSMIAKQLIGLDSLDI